MSDGRYDVVLSDNARRALRQIEADDKEAVAAAMRVRLDTANPGPEGDPDVLLVDLESTRSLGLDPDHPYLLLAVPPAHYILYRQLSEAERQKQSERMGEDLLNPTFLVVDVLAD